ncbi:3-hydroxyacyl-ACP dehydratase [Parafilimonas sp.]|uniref:3-hydroxyacyl-ACP dehydratase n=1 Tax=Parafilimonas sp. TaxID=1969739 RepID=UPI0039E36363
MITKDILPFIPQRAPFVMIDALLYVDNTVARTLFAPKADNVFNEGGFFAEAGLLENIAQTAAAGAGHNALQQNRPAPLGYIAAVKNFEVFFLPAINSELITEIVTTGHVMNMQLITGKIVWNDALVAQCEMRIFIEQNLLM